MSSEVPDVRATDQDYAQMWAECTSRVLDSLQAAPFVATSRPPAAAETAVTAVGESLWVRFKVSGRLAGEQAFQFTRSDGVRMAQLLMSETLDGAAAFTESHADAVSEIFRQFAGMAATACKGRYGGEVEFHLETPSLPQWKPERSAVWMFSAPQIQPLQWTLLLSPELQAALEGAGKPTAAPPPPSRTSGPPAAVAPSAPPAPSQLAASLPTAPPESAPAAAPLAVANPVASAGGQANLDLLLDVKLDAMLRFGERVMPLREILELRPGSVVELNRRIQEPAELLVSGRLVARGEVVIVDGNYGLRVTDIVHPRERLESVST